MILLAIDPGESSALVALEWTKNSIPTLVHGHQTPGGVQGFLDLLAKAPKYDEVICEKFSPRPSSVTGFQQSLKTTLPLVCEGIMIGRELMPVYTLGERRWVTPDAQYLVGGKDRADKRKRQHKFLKDSGYYRTGKDFGTADADDFRSACAHGIAYLARVKKHVPSYNLISTWVKENPA